MKDVRYFSHNFLKLFMIVRKPLKTIDAKGFYTISNLEIIGGMKFVDIITNHKSKYGA